MNNELEMKAIELIRVPLFYKKLQEVIEIPMLNLLNEFLTDRKAYVELDGHSSVFFRFEAGCPQGSTLGLKVFNMYCRELSTELKEGHIVTYADDTYVIVSEKTESGLMNKANKLIEKQVNC